jgi:hypothetical protein
MKKQKVMATIMAWVLITALIGVLTVVFYNASSFAGL